VFGCTAAPASGCEAGAKVQINVNERSFGKEQIKVLVDKLGSTLPLSFFGDPIAGNTNYAICLYDAKNTLAATLAVNRPQDLCGLRTCWNIVKSSGYKYLDKELAAHGVLQIQVKSGPAGTGRFFAKAKRNLPKGLLAMPVDITPQLEGDRHATVQLRLSNGNCITGTVDNVSDADSTLFKGKTP